MVGGFRLMEAPTSDRTAVAPLALAHLPGKLGEAGRRQLDGRRSGGSGGLGRSISLIYIYLSLPISHGVST